MRRLYAPIFAALYIIVLARPASCQVRKVSLKTCPEAQIIAIKGVWIANPGKPGERRLKDWDCVAGGDEISLSRLSPSGEMTVVYHTGIEPHTERCPSHAECRNAYPVEKANGAPTAPIWEIIPRPSARPVPGILHGSLGPHPTLICGDEGNADLRVALGKPIGKGRLFMRQVDPQIQNDDWRAVTGYTFLFSDSQPTLYEMELTRDNNPQGSALVLIAPHRDCVPLSNAYKMLVQYTDTWPKDVSPDAVWDFHSAFLRGLVVGAKSPPKE